jgi:hypothetical protein
MVIMLNRFQVVACNSKHFQCWCCRVAEIDKDEQSKWDKRTAHSFIEMLDRRVIFIKALEAFAW